MLHLIDPRLSQVFRDIQACKCAKTCPKLTMRSLYFEPNPVTLSEWASNDGEFLAFRGKLDRRVVFVCESPGAQKPFHNPLKVERCWSKTAQDRRFFRMRRRHGLENCHVTNSVKCGVRRGGRHSDQERQACSSFLKRELEIISPLVAVGVGSNAMWALRAAAREMKDPPVLFQITHYSARRGQPEKEWAHEIPELLRLLGRLKARDLWPI